MFLKPTGLVPSAVQFVNAPDVGVPRTGVVSVGEVKVLFVTVCVFVAVRTFDGVMIPDKVVMIYSDSIQLVVSF